LEGTDLLELGVLVLVALLLRLDLGEVNSEAINNAILVRNDANLLCDDLLQVRDERRDFLQVRVSAIAFSVLSAVGHKGRLAAGAN
jgi:hypothetical protein